jgi:hypothetical protein
MLVNHVPLTDPHPVYVQARPAPRCYVRAKPRTTTKSRADFDEGMVLLLLSVLTAVAAFWLAYRGWRF